MNNIDHLTNFLDNLILDKLQDKLQDKRQYHISKKELIKLIDKYFISEGLSGDPVLIFEKWEDELRFQKIIKDYTIIYSGTKEILTIQWLPSWENIDWATEIRTDNLDNELKNTIKHFDGYEFEHFIRDVFNDLPWMKEVRITKLSGDGGIDFVGKFIDEESHMELPVLGEAKHWTSKVGAKQIRDFLGGILLKENKRPTIGIYVSTSGFSEDALKNIRLAPVKIMTYDIDSITELMIKYKIGISNVAITGLKLDRGFWSNISV